jgi:PiT family inorganic phosphate transporter
LLSFAVGCFHNRWAAAHANALIRDCTSDVDWSKATEIGHSLLLSPMFGFYTAALLLLILKALAREPELW